MMKEPPLLSSSRSKIARAREHLKGLQLEFERFAESKPYRFSVKCDFETGKKMLVYHSLGGIPTDWQIVIGEVAYQLRSALDHAIYELTEWEQGSPLEMTEYPIFDKKLSTPEQSGFIKLKKDGTPAPRGGLYRIRGLRQETIDLIESVQPYNTRTPDTPSALALLNDMSVDDKHKTWLLCCCTYVNPTLKPLGDSVYRIDPADGKFVYRGGVDFGRLEEGTVVTWWFPEALNDEVDMDAELPIQISLDERSIPGFKHPQPVLQILNWLGNFTEVHLNNLVESVR